MQTCVCLLANLFIRSTAFRCFSCLDVPRRWRSIRRAAALLIKAAAAAASGKLLPSCARICCVLRRREAPSLLLPDVKPLNPTLTIADSSITLPPVAGLPRLLDVGAGKPHARVRSSSHVQVNVPYRIGDGCACTCLGSTLASLCLCFLRSSCALSCAICCASRWLKVEQGDRKPFGSDLNVIETVTGFFTV